MKYLCLLWFDGTKLDVMPKAEKDEVDRNSLDHDRELKRKGHLIMAQALQSPAAAVTVRVRNGKASTTDGPFIETKEHLGGFILIEAKDMDEAVRLAAEIPLAKIGLASVEVRPIYIVDYPAAPAASA
jgi:hypothetical protein